MSVAYRPLFVVVLLGVIACCAGGGGGSSSSEEDLPDCSDGVYRFHADPTNCLQFYNCYNTLRSHFTCPEGGVWTNDPSVPACLQSYDVNEVCGDRPYNPPTRIPRFITITVNVVDTNVGAPIDVTVSGFMLQEPLYNMMLQLDALNTQFRFTSTFHSVWWRSINCINDVCSAGTYYWKISVGGTSIPVGTSSYIPEDGITVKFEYVSWAG